MYVATSRTKLASDAPFVEADTRVRFKSQLSKRQDHEIASSLRICACVLTDIKPGDASHIVNVSTIIGVASLGKGIVHAICSPVTVNSSLSLQSSINLMGEKQIWDLPVVDDGKLSGLLHLHPAIKAVMGDEK